MREEPRMMMRSVGKVSSPLMEPGLTYDGDLRPGKGWDSKNIISEIHVEEDLLDAMDGLEGFSHIMVVYLTNLELEDGLLKVHPAGQHDVPKRGIFATRSPARPNPVAVTTAVLLCVRDNVITVRGLDAINGSVVIDIKPHMTSYDEPPERRYPDWMVEIQSRFH